MAWINPPVRVSERGAAIRSRYVYVNSLSKGFLVYNGIAGKTHRFFVKEYPGSTDTWIIDADIGIVDNFDVSEAEANNQIVIVYANNIDIFSLYVDFNTRAVIDGPTRLFTGSSPALTRERPPRVNYIKNDNLQYRRYLDSSEYEVGDAPDKLFLQTSCDMLYDSETKVRFSSQMVPAEDIALPFSNIANTLIWYDGQTVNPSPRSLDDRTGNGYDLLIGSMSIDANLGLTYDNSYTPNVQWPVPSTALTVEAWIWMGEYNYLNQILYPNSGNNIIFGFNNNGKLQFKFTHVGENALVQISDDIKVQENQLIHVCLSHTWGANANTYLSINGSQVEAVWETSIAGNITSILNSGGYIIVTTTTNHGLSTTENVELTGTTNYNGIHTITAVTSNTFTLDKTYVSDEYAGRWKARHGVDEPSYGTITSNVLLGNKSYLHSMRILSVARSISNTRNYIDGKAL